jgi:hypothetical protein
VTRRNPNGGGDPADQRKARKTAIIAASPPAPGGDSNSTITATFAAIFRVPDKRRRFSHEPGNGYHGRDAP